MMSAHIPKPITRGSRILTAVPDPLIPEVALVEFPWWELDSGCIWLIAAKAGTYTHERVLVEEELSTVSNEPAV